MRSNQSSRMTILVYISVNIRCHHMYIYHDRWLLAWCEARLGVVYARYVGNVHVHDLLAVKITKSPKRVGHMPNKISSMCLLFLRLGGTIL